MPAMIWERGRARIAKLYATTIYLAGTALSFTAAQFNQVMAAFGTVTFDRAIKVARTALTGAAIHAGTGGVIAWQNPEAVSILILDVRLAVTTVSTGACTLDIGTTATSATTTSDNIFDGLDATTTAPVYYSMSDASLDTATNIGIKPLAAGKWVTIDEKTGDATGLVGVLYVEYILV